MGLLRALTITTGILASSVSFAQETVDVGVLKNSDLRVVQDILYPKDGALEIGGHVGWMPFDPLVTTPIASLSIDKHFNEELAFSAVIGGGYGMKTQKYRDLETPAYGSISPYVFRHLGHALFGAAWSPIYAKASAGGTRVVHFDFYLAARAGATLGQSIIPGGGFTVAPTVSPAIGMRFFMNKSSSSIRVELRDDLMMEYRELTSSWHFKQTPAVTVGYTAMLGRKKGGRR